MTDEERLEFERLKVRVAELETRPSDPQALEAAIQGSAMEKVARLELATLPPGWDVGDQEAVRRVTNISLGIGLIVGFATLIFLAFPNLLGWAH
jgi:hypothetical protein